MDQHSDELIAKTFMRVLLSNTLEAVELKKWILTELIPTIVQTGEYPEDTERKKRLFKMFDRFYENTSSL